jgi:hypothetical protein
MKISLLGVLAAWVVARSVFAMGIAAQPQATRMSTQVADATAISSPVYRN